MLGTAQMNKSTDSTISHRIFPAIHSSLTDSESVQYSNSIGEKSEQDNCHNAGMYCNVDQFRLGNI